MFLASPSDESLGYFQSSANADWDLIEFLCKAEPRPYKYDHALRSMDHITTEFELIDVSHTVENGMVTYKGLPPPLISDHLTREQSKALYAPGTQFHIGKIEMVANTGTYIDSPFHRYEDGADLADLKLTSLANLDGLVIRRIGTNERRIGLDAVDGLDVERKAVLFHTGWDRHWRTDAYSDGTHPFLDGEAAEYLANAGAALVGIDSFNIDDTGYNSRPAHSTLLRQRIPVVEHLCGLDELPDDGFKFFAVPVKVRNFGTFPVRAFAMVLRAVGREERGKG